jgi:hypothetical protein
MYLAKALNLCLDTPLGLVLDSKGLELINSLAPLLE